MYTEKHTSRIVKFLLLPGKAAGSPYGLALESVSRLPRPRLFCRKRQPGDSPDHPAKQPFRQVALRPIATK